ncbi:hypothetical protein DY000_02021051 [Brassica cretica]|uniref:Uncharacterized protein n=1 Tax=Brassica cretica TaxID=69181 RepID=A0ABQ7EKT4_BRACR|nr:hypothetical protein DY000_02021051 [Brassica cretica]
MPKFTRCALVHHPFELKVGDVFPLCVQWRVDTRVVMYHCYLAVQEGSRSPLEASEEGAIRVYDVASLSKRVLNLRQNTLGYGEFKKRLQWCVCADHEAIHPNLFLAKSRRDLEDVEEQMGECANIGRGRTAMYGPVRTGRDQNMSGRLCAILGCSEKGLVGWNQMSIKKMPLDYSWKQATNGNCFGADWLL